MVFICLSGSLLMCIRSVMDVMLLTRILLKFYTLAFLCIQIHVENHYIPTVISTHLTHQRCPAATLNVSSFDMSTYMGLCMSLIQYTIVLLSIMPLNAHSLHLLDQQSTLNELSLRALSLYDQVSYAVFPER